MSKLAICWISELYGTVVSGAGVIHDLLPLLQHFAEHGTLPSEAE
jgi:hypothetical protein